MSAPSTPVRSGHGSSMSTPTSNHGSEEQLTPRSKVKAMLAALDDDSDDDLPQDSNLRQSKTTSHGKIDPGTEVLPPVQSESDEDESDLVAPRGKLASRLFPERNAVAQRDSTIITDPATDAYARVKDRLLRKSPTPTETQAGNQADPHDEAVGWTKKVLRRKRQKIVELDDGEKQEHGGLDTSKHYDSTSKEQSDTSPSQGGVQCLATTPEVTKEQGSLFDSEGSEPDLPENPLKNARFLELVARKREERAAREAEQERKRAERQKMFGSDSKQPKRDIRRSEMSETDGEGEDVDTGKKLTQQSRPTRKASKKALEEMSRETQRLSRNMQLAHEAKTKKKITKDSLLERFGFNKTSGTSGPAQQSSSTTMSSVPASDIEGPEKHETPPTSPDKPGKSMEDQIPPVIEESEMTTVFDADEELPSLGEVLASQPVFKGKGKAIQGSTAEEVAVLEKSKKPVFTQRPIIVRPPKHPVRPERFTLDSDSDLEVLPFGKGGSKKPDVFERLPIIRAAKEPSLIKLRALAHLTSPSKQRKNPKSSITPGELQASLRRQARQQAAKERAEKLQDLKDRGIVVQTAEEREHDHAVVEDMLEKARQENEELAKKEKAASKKEREENGEDGGLESSEDEDYEEQEDDADVELSGSDEEAERESDEDDDDEQGAPGSKEEKIESFIDNEASGDGDDNRSGLEDENEEEVADDGSVQRDQDSDEDLNIVHTSRRSKAKQVLDEDDDTEREKNMVPEQSSGLSSTKPIVNPFGAQVSNPDNLPMGLTQAFASTMADAQGFESQANGEEDSISMLASMPMPGSPVLEENSLIRDSQTQGDEGPDVDLHLTQSQILQDTALQERITGATQCSQIPDPTQDAGFQGLSPVTSRFIPPPPSAVDTVIVGPDVIHESPVAKKKGRLYRRIQAIANFSDEEGGSVERQSDTDDDNDDRFEVSANAFDVMKKATKKSEKLAETFDKKKSNAKAMVEEQAEESEDEYAGLGGASDEDSEAEDDEEIENMIDEGQVDVDERKLAAFYADNERASDEKAVEKLFKDINNGLLRKKRGADFELSDSDHEAEARQRRKRREFARMRKALLEDAAVGKIAEDPKKLAFIRAIEDREDEEDGGIDILDATLESPEPVSTQEVPDSQIENHPPPMGTASTATAAPISTLKRKRPLEEAHPTVLNRTPSARRTIATRKPATLAEIRASVSFLTEDPHSLSQSLAEEPSSDLSAPEDDAPSKPSTSEDITFVNPRRRRLGPDSTTVIDRLSLKRQESSSLSAANPSTSHLAFADPTAQSSNPTFKVPSLLRRATTGLTSASAADEHGISTRRGSAGGSMERAAGGGAGVVKKGGSKRSSVQYFAREMERRERVREEEGKRKREEARGRGGKGSVLGVLGGGRFE